MPEPVNRLLAIADDEDRRRGVGNALAFSPRVDEELHEPPLQPARVLKLVDQDVVVARLQLQAAARELFLPRQEPHGSLEHAGKVEQGVLVEQPLVDPGGNREEAKETTRQEAVDVGIETLEFLADAGCKRLHRLLVAAARLRGDKESRAKLAPQLAAWVPLFRQEVPFEPAPELLHARRTIRRIARVLETSREIVERRQVREQPGEFRRPHRAVADECRAVG